MDAGGGSPAIHACSAGGGAVRSEQELLRRRIPLRNAQAGEYFSSVTAATAFCQVGIRPALTKLPREISLLDLGGGDGHLAAHVATYLRDHGRRVTATVVERNAVLAERASLRGLNVVCGDARQAAIRRSNLVIMRCVAHVLDVDELQLLLCRIRERMAPGGIFVTQLNSGTRRTCRLHEQLTNHPLLRRAKPVVFMTPKEYVALLEAAALRSTIAGYAPPFWTSMRHQWDIASKIGTADYVETQAERVRRLSYLASVGRILRRAQAEGGAGINTEALTLRVASPITLAW